MALVLASLAYASSAAAALHQAGMVTDINPGAGSSDALGGSGGLDLNGTLYFTADDGTHGTELWKSDGTAAGTTMVRDINPGAGGSDIFDLTNLNGTVYFSATNDGTNYELWKSDGTEAGTQQVTHLSSSGGTCCTEIVNVGGTLFFGANDGTNGQELWKSDGTEAGTTMVKDINPTGDSSPAELTDVGGTLFFKANDGTDGSELWTSDGTEANTQMVKDINLGPDHSFADSLTNVDGTLYFTADDGTNGRELWTSDGTEANTQMVKDINPSGDGLDCCFPHLAHVGGTLFFTARDGTNGAELWTSNGTEAGTQMVEDLNPGPSSSTAAGSEVNVGGTVFLTATDGTTGLELWKSDGTVAGTQLVKDINPGPAHSIPLGLTDVNGTLFFTADDGTHGTELWESDGTTAGTELVRDIDPGPDPSNPNDLIDVNGTAFFQADDGTNGNELWRTFTDTTAPSGGHITTNLPAFKLTTPFTVAWGGATDSGSGVQSYKAFVRSAHYDAAFGIPTLFKTTPGPGSGSFLAQPGNTYCFFVKVADKVGNVSAPSAQKCTSMPVDDPSLTGSGWTRRSGRFGYYRGTYSQSSTKGATLTLTGVKAKRLALVATTCPSCGAVQVLQGATLLKQVNLAAASVEHRVFTVASFASVHSGMVRIKIVTAGKPVIIDGLGVSRG